MPLQMTVSVDSGALKHGGQGLQAVESLLLSLANGLQDVPKRFARRADVQQSLTDIAKGSLLEFDIEDKRTAINNIHAAPTADGTGIVVYEAMNDQTRATWPDPGASDDPYIMFFLTEYATESFLRPKGKKAVGRDFFALWPERMKPVAIDAFNEEVAKVLKGGGQ